MSYGVFRRHPVARRLPYARRVLAVLTVAGAAATTSLPLARGRPPQSVYRQQRPQAPPARRYIRRLAPLTARRSDPLARFVPPPAHLFRPRFVQYRRRGIAGLPNVDAVEVTASRPIVRRRLPYRLYLHPDPPIVHRRRMVIGLPNADTAARKGLLSYAEIELPLGPKRGILSYAELEIPLAPRRGLLSYAELETGFPPSEERVIGHSYHVLFGPLADRPTLIHGATLWLSTDTGTAFFAVPTTVPPENAHAVWVSLTFS